MRVWETVTEEARGGQGPHQSWTLSGVARSMGSVLEAMGKHCKILVRGVAWPKGDPEQSREPRDLCVRSGP